MLLALAAPASLAAPVPVDVRFGRHPGFWRMAVEWAQPVPADIDLRGETVVIAPLVLADGLGPVQSRLGPVLRHAEYEGQILRLHLRPGVRAERLTGVAPTILAVDFRPGAAARPAAGLASIVPRRRGDAMAAGPPATIAGATDLVSPPPTAPMARHEAARPAASDPAASGPAASGPAASDRAASDRDVGDPAGIEPAADAADRGRAAEGWLPPLPAAITDTAAPAAPPAPAEATTPAVAVTEAAGAAIATPAAGASDRPAAGTASSTAAAPAEPAADPAVDPTAAAGATHRGRAVRVPIDRAASSRVATVPIPPPPPAAAMEEAAPTSAAPPATPAEAPPETPAATAPTPEPEPEAGAPALPSDLVPVTASDDALIWAFREPVAAAAWRRGEHLWVVFAAPDLRLAPGPAVAARLERLEHARAMVLRIAVPAAVDLRLERDGARWRLGPGAPTAPGASANSAPATATEITVADDWLGATLRVAMTRDPVRLAAGRREGSRVWLATLQGHVFLDLADPAAPALSARGETEPDGTGRGPASLVPELPLPELGPVFGLDGPTLERAAARQRRQALERSLFAEPVPARRLALARLLIGQGAPFDALAVLAAGGGAETSPAAAERLAALTGAAAVLAGRLDTAAAALLRPGPDATQEVWLWSAMHAGAAGDWARAGTEFARSGQAWRAYPMPLRRAVARYAARAALELDAPQVALAVLAQVEHADLAVRRAARLSLLEAEALLAAGETVEGHRLLRRLSRPPTDPEVRREAELRRVRHAFAAGDLDAAAALATLAPARVAWTARPEAAAYWTLVAELEAATGAAVAAFDAWARVGGAAGLRPEQEALIRDVVAGAPPFADALADAVELVAAHGDALPAGADRAALFVTLAERVAAESDALHVADRLYGQALRSSLPAALATDIRIALAELRLERRVPGAALDALAPLAPAADPRIAPLRRRAEALREGRLPTPPTPPTAAAAPAPTRGPAAGEADGITATMEAVDDLLAETRALLEGADDGS